MKGDRYEASKIFGPTWSQKKFILLHSFATSERSRSKADSRKTFGEAVFTDAFSHAPNFSLRGFDSR
jgi:hypothetical protein